MTHTFDTLAYAKHLERAGIERKHAEAHAKAARRYIMQDLVTKHELELQLARLTLKMGTMMTAIVGIFFMLDRMLG